MYINYDIILSERTPSYIASSSGTAGVTATGNTAGVIPEHSGSSIVTPGSSPSPAYHTPSGSSHVALLNSARTQCGLAQSSMGGSHIARAVGTSTPTGVSGSSRQTRGLMQLPAVKFLTRPDLFTLIQNNEASTLIL